MTREEEAREHRRTKALRQWRAVSPNRTRFLSDDANDRAYAREELERIEVPLRAGPESFGDFLAGEGLTEGEFYPEIPSPKGEFDPPYEMDLGTIAKFLYRTRKVRT